MTTSLRLGLFGAALLVIGGCASTKVTNTWQAPQAQSEELQSVLVIGLAGNEPVRRQLEDRLAAELRARGVKATQGYRFADQGESLTRDALQQLATTHDFDGVMVTRFLGTETEVHYEPHYTYLDYYGSMWDDIYGTGRIVMYDVVKAESRLFSVKQPGKLLWSATAETYDPGSPRAATEKIARRFVAKMDEDLGI